jgi:hypothetical protein
MLIRLAPVPEPPSLELINIEGLDNGNFNNTRELLIDKGNDLSDKFVVHKTLLLHFLGNVFQWSAVDSLQELDYGFRNVESNKQAKPKRKD